MTQNPSQSIPTVPSSDWFYAVNDQRFGPLAQDHLMSLLAGGQVPLTALVWREGMANWLPASAVPELQDGMTPPPVFPPPFTATPAMPVDKRQARIIKNAKQNCIVMFILFCLQVTTTLSTIILGFASTPQMRTYGRSGGGVFLSASCWSIAAIFALFYVPIRWKVILALPKTYKVLGLIGGLGLIGLLALALFGMFLAKL